MPKQKTSIKNILVLGGTGKTGKLIVETLNHQGYHIRVGSRFGTPAFAWENPTNWCDILEEIDAVYINFAPDLAIPTAANAIQAFVNLAIESGVKRAVLLSGRGEEEAQRCETLIQRNEWEWTIIRASWFAQNFSEGAFTEMVQVGTVALPTSQIKEPFIDVNDIAEIATIALTQDGHNRQVYEVTGPELISFPDAIAEISKATGRSIEFHAISMADFIEGAKQQNQPEEMIWLLNYLFETVLDGRNAYLTDGVQRSLGRAPKSFSEYAKRTASTGIWDKVNEAAL